MSEDPSFDKMASFLSVPASAHVLIVIGGLPVQIYGVMNNDHMYTTQIVKINFAFQFQYMSVLSESLLQDKGQNLNLETIFNARIVLPVDFFSLLVVILQP